MADIPDKWRDEANEVAVAAHGAARDDKDIRTDRVTARLLDMCVDLQGKVFDHMTITGASVREIKDGLERVEKRVEEFVSAFPNKDPAGHRQAHENDITAAGKRDTFREKMKFAFWALVMAAVTIWIGIVMWKAFLIGPKG